MDNKSFWLASIGIDSLTVSLVSSQNGQYKVAAIGPEVLYQSTPDSFVAAIDQSLSESASSIALPETEEPNSIALIISPFWVGSDGKISSDKLRLFELMFKNLKLNPMGFISYDEAIVEEANISDGFPASFIIVNIESTSIIVSLTYLGKVIERITKTFTETFTPNLLESAILEFKTDSTLPPQIILLGEVGDEIFNDIKNFPWIGKKNIETFLHFPEIKKYSALDLNTIYTKAITSQFQPSASSPPEEELPIIEEVVVPTEELQEVSKDEFGFTEGDNFTIPEEIPEPVKDIIEDKQPKKLPTISLPKIAIPKIKLPKFNFLLYIFAAFPILILIPIFFSTAKVTIFVTPNKFSKTVNVILDPAATEINTTNNSIPVKLSTKTVNNSASLPTTGKKIIGQKAQGEITIFNKQDKVQTLAKGTILLDSSGNKFELISQVQVASSSSDLSLGVINLGKTNAMAMAADIGPEFNLGKDSSLNFKDFSSSSLVAKVSAGLSGGSKSEVKAVSATDKSNIEAKLNSEVSAVSSEETGLVTISKNGRIEFNREVGEEADELNATIQTTVSTYSIDNSQKLSIINSFMSGESGFRDSIINPDNFELKFTSKKTAGDAISGQIAIEGTSLPVINSPDISKMISGKFVGQASTLLKNYPRVYNFKIITNIPYLPLPFKLSNISVEVK